MRSGVLLSQIADADTFFSDPGSEFQTEYVGVLEHGNVVLKEVGKFKVSDRINAYRDLCDMSYIISRINAGDASPLYARQTFYGDVSEFQDDHRFMLQTVLDARTYFDKLSPETKARFGNDFGIWIQSAGSKEWSDIMTNSTNSVPGTHGSDLHEISGTTPGSENVSVSKQEV